MDWSVRLNRADCLDCVDHRDRSGRLNPLVQDRRNPRLAADRAKLFLEYVRVWRWRRRVRPCGGCSRGSAV